MKKIFFVFVCFLFVAVTTNAQSKGSGYKTALGIKAWDGGGISFKTFVQDRQAVELIGYFYKNGTRITGLYQFHQPIKNASGLQWYVGPGAHIGFYKVSGDGSKAFAGVDGVLGLDYKFPSAPINLSLDWQPSFEFGDNRGFVGSWGGFAIRYTFK